MSSAGELEVVSTTISTPLDQKNAHHAGQSRQPVDPEVLLAASVPLPEEEEEEKEQNAEQDAISTASLATASSSGTNWSDFVHPGE